MSATLSQSTTKSSTTTSGGTFFSLLDSILLCALIVAMCTQINLGDIGQDTTAEGYVTKQLKVALPDITLFLCFGWFCVRTTFLRAWGKIWWPPLPCWALIFALVLATFHSRPLINAVAESLSGAEGVGATVRALLTKESKEAIADTIQFAGYFLLAPLLFVNLIHDSRTGVLQSRRRLALWTFFLSLMSVALLACWQLLQGSEAPRALFSSPNAYAGFCALAIPLLLARLASARVRTPFAIALSIGAVLLLAATIVSLWAMLVILLALGLVGILLRMPARAFTALAGAGVLMLALWSVQTSLSPARVESARLGSETEAVKKQFVEWYVAATRIGDQREGALATGAGPGNYQFNIGVYYVSLPNEERMPPDSNNLYLVQAVNLGLLGLGALLWMVFRFGQIALTALRKYPNDWLAAGVLGSLTAWLIVNCFHALIVRGTGVVLAFIFALAIVALQRNREGEPLKIEENRNYLADWMS